MKFESQDCSREPADRGRGSTLDSASKGEMAGFIADVEIHERTGHGEAHPIAFRHSHAWQQKAQTDNTLDDCSHMIECSHNHLVGREYS